MSFHNLFTGTSQGEFDSLKVRDASGQMVDVLSLGGGGSGSVTSAQSPLSISGAGVLQIDLSTYLTSAQTNSLLASYTTTAGINTLLANYVLASSLYNGNSIKLQDANGVTRLLSASQTGALVWNTAQLVSINDLTTSSHWEAGRARCWYWNCYRGQHDICLRRRRGYVGHGPFKH